MAKWGDAGPVEVSRNHAWRRLRSLPLIFDTDLGEIEANVSTAVAEPGR